MADLSITAAEVLKSSGGKSAPGTCGETLVAGDIVYKDASASSKLKLADANHSTTAKSAVVGMMLNGGAAGQPADYVSEDSDLTIGTTAAAAAGQIYCLSSTPGKLCPISDIVASATARVSIVGVGGAAGKLIMKVVNSGVAKTS